MAEEKKPKIDLKARLGKASNVSAPPGGGAVPVPVPPPASASRPPPAIPPPVVPGIPVGPTPFSSPSIDPSNPLAAVAAPYRPPQPAAPAQPQRIEVDDATVQQARSGARKQGMIIAAVAAVIFAGVGYVAGGASEKGDARVKSKNDATELAKDVETAKGQLDKIATLVESGRNQLVKEKKFPDTLAKELGGVNVDFDGTKLAGRRFSGFPTETTGNLVEFVTGVQSLNDRKAVLIGLLSKLQKPLTDQLAAPPGQTTVNFVVAVDKDPSGNAVGIIAPLATPVTFTPPNVSLPAEFTFTNPLTGGSSKAPAYKGGDILNKPAAMYVLPKAFDKACPSETSGAAAQLAAQLGNTLRDIKGEGGGGGTGDQAFVEEGKPGLLARADRLIDGLRKVK